MTTVFFKRIGQERARNPNATDSIVNRNASQFIDWDFPSLQRYQLLEMLGKGSYGEVAKATDKYGHQSNYFFLFQS